MNIPYLIETDRSEFYPLIVAALTDSGKRLPLVVDLGKKGGYSGVRFVRIGPATPKEFESDIDLVDVTRFPARIRAAATALRDSGFTGDFSIAHSDGRLQIELAKQT